MKTLKKLLKRRQPPAPPPPPVELLNVPHGTFYQDIDALPLDRFVKVVTTGELKHLIIEGEPDAFQLGRAWSGIFIDYLDAIRHTDSRYKYQLSNEIAVLSSKIARFETYLFLLQTLYAVELRDELRAMGFEDLELDPDNLDSYLEALRDLKTRSREWSIDLQLKKIELEELIKADRDKGAGGLDQQYFLRILDRIATHKRVAVIRASEVTVAEFCAMVNELVDHNKALRNKNNP